MVCNVKSIATTALAFSALGSSHMMIAKPVPYGKATLNTSPLVDVLPGTSTSDYPCKQRTGVYDITEMNHVTVGKPYELSFIGSASHGGGTCQLTMTKDKEPTANSTFKIFQVFEGGCPVSSDGNSGSHPFTYVLPKDMPNGVMTFAWYWYNRIGNRELYMNCAPMTVSGGSDNDDYFNSLPNVYLVNMPTSECQTSFEGIQNAVTIPHPGQNILKDTAGQEMHAAVGPGCAAAAAKQIAGVSGYKSNVVTNNGAAYMFPSGAKAAPAPSGSGAASVAPGGSAAPSGGAAPSAAPSGSAPAPSGGAGGSVAPSGSAAAPSGSAAAPAPSGSGAASAPAGSAAPSAGAAPSGSVAAPAPSGSAAAAAPSGSAAASAAPSAAPSGAPAASAAPSAPASGSAGVAPSAAAPSGSAPSGAACSDTSAAMSCSSDGSKFGVCDNGTMVWRAVAPGTSCVNGAIQKRSEFRNPHVRRHIRVGHGYAV